jgi:GntR family transcriptional regulator, vanillate catabolism transcriptional regulator
MGSHLVVTGCTRALRAGILRCQTRLLRYQARGGICRGVGSREQNVAVHMNTQQTRALVRIREMILQGKLSAGQRVAEAPLAERLGMSRTPVRQALPVLAEEGLLVEHATRGYVVRETSTADILDAIDVRGVIEGLAARRVAERGASRSLCQALRACLADGDRIFNKGHIEESDEALYADMNARLHALIVREARSPLIEQTLERNARIPFVGPQALAFDRTGLGRMYDMLLYAHRQHHFIVAALERGEGARVEALMREHANPVKDSLNLPGIKVTQRQPSPGLALVR